MVSRTVMLSGPGCALSERLCHWWLCGQAICPNEEGECAVIQANNAIWVPFYGAGFPYGCAGEETNDAMVIAFGLPSR